LRQGFDSDPVQDCIKCGAKSNRKIHAPPVIFKGSGWYVTDYGKGRGNNGFNSDRAEEKSSDSEASEGSKSKNSDKSSETKSEAKSASSSSNSE
jgi:predicted nucleic acid-binding Zn ribbon protein